MVAQLSYLFNPCFRSDRDMDTLDTHKHHVHTIDNLVIIKEI